MESQENTAAPVAAPAQTGADAGTPRPAGPLAGGRELRSALLAVEFSRSRLRTDEMRGRYARMARNLVATEAAAALSSRWAELLPHRADRFRALSAAAEKAAREWRRATDGEHRGGGTTVAASAVGPERASAKDMAAVRLESEALAQRLKQAVARLRATSAEIRQGRPRQEMLRHPAIARMQAKLVTLPVIEQAKGIIMAQSHCGPDEAFDMLRRLSQRLNVPVRELAAQIVANTAGGSGAGVLAAPPYWPARTAEQRERLRRERLSGANGRAARTAERRETIDIPAG